jgi:hypothetical protein
MPQIYLRQEAYDRIVEAGQKPNLQQILVRGVDLALEELRQVPKSDPIPELSKPTSTITEAAPTVTSDKPSQKKRKVTKPKPLPDPTYTIVKTGLFGKALECNRCFERFKTEEDFNYHKCFPPS